MAVVLAVSSTGTYTYNMYSHEFDLLPHRKHRARRVYPGADARPPGGSNRDFPLNAAAGSARQPLPALILQKH
jgi:hypothetical protein